MLREVGDMASSPTLLLISLEPAQISFPLQVTSMWLFQETLSPLPSREDSGHQSHLNTCANTAGEIGPDTRLLSQTSCLGLSFLFWK